MEPRSRVEATSVPWGHPPARELWLCQDCLGSTREKKVKWSDVCGGGYAAKKPGKERNRLTPALSYAAPAEAKERKHRPILPFPKPLPSPGRAAERRAQEGAEL